MLNVLPLSDTVDDEAGGNLNFGDVAVVHLSLVEEEDERSERADAEVEVKAVICWRMV